MCGDIVYDTFNTCNVRFYNKPGMLFEMDMFVRPSYVLQFIDIYNLLLLLPRRNYLKEWYNFIMPEDKFWVTFLYKFFYSFISGLVWLIGDFFFMFAFHLKDLWSGLGLMDVVWWSFFLSSLIMILLLLCISILR